MEDEADETDELPVDPSEEEAVDPFEQAPPAESDDRTSGPGGPPRWQMVLVGLLVGAVIGGGLAWWSNRDDDSGAASEQEALTGPDDLDESPEAADAFIDAWERSRTETYLSGSLLRRTLSSAVALELPIVVAQRPPDRVVSTGSSVQADVGGENTVCDEQLDGIVHCQPGGPAADYDAQVQAELDNLRSYVEGDTPVYKVSVSEGCFDLRLVAAIHAPPYGHNARFCFDAVSGAPRLIRIERNEGTDEVTLVTVRTDVTDEDIARVAAGDVDEELLAG